MAKNILYLHDTSKIAGAERSLFNLVKNLDKEFIPLFILPNDGPYVELLNSIGINPTFIPLDSVKYPINFINSLKKIITFIRANNISIIHSNSPRTNLYGGISALLTGKKSVFHARNLLTYEKIDPDLLLSPLTDAILCNSAAIKRRFFNLKKAIVVMNGIDINKFNPQTTKFDYLLSEFNIDKKNLIIGMTSRFGPDKGHEEFLEAACNLVNLGYKNLTFLIVGDAVFEVDKKREKYIKSLVQKYNLEKNVLFTGFRNDIPNLLALMDIFVLPAHQEPCGRVLFEAEAMEVPIVGTNSGGTPEIVEDGVTGFLFSPKDAKLLTEKLETLIKNEKLRLKMGKAGRQRAKQLFKIENNSNLTMKVYRKLLKQ